MNIENILEVNQLPKNSGKQKTISNLILEMISSSVLAKSSIEKALSKAKENKILEAKRLIKKAQKILTSSEKIRFCLIQNESKNDVNNLSLLLVHAESQVSMIQSLLLFSHELVAFYEIYFKEKN